MSRAPSDAVGWLLYRICIHLFVLYRVDIMKFLVRLQSVRLRRRTTSLCRSFRGWLCYRCWDLFVVSVVSKLLALLRTSHRKFGFVSSKKMSEGRELACALHFQLESAIQLVGALGGCILVVRSTGESAQDLMKVLGMEGPAGSVAIRSAAAVDGISLAAQATSHRSFALNRSSGLSASAAGVGLSSLPSPSPKLMSSNVAQFRCIALSGRTAHRAFAHESMLTGVVEAGLSLNIALAAEPFLAVPIGAGAGSYVGVLCLAYKANPLRIQFDGEDESVAFACSRMIAATLTRCAAAKYVTPYDINRLANLGLHTTLASEVSPMELATTTGGGGGAAASSSSSYARGLVYRSSSRSVLAARVERLHGEEIPSLSSLLELSQVVKDLEVLLLNQQSGVNRHLEAQHGLEKRLRNVQHDLTTLQLTATRDKSEGEAFRLAGRMLQDQLNSKIAHSEVAKLHQSEIQSSVNAEVLGFLDQAQALLNHQSSVSSGARRSARGSSGTTADESRSFYRCLPAPPPVVPPRPTAIKPNISKTNVLQRPRTGGSLKMPLA